MPKEKNYVRYAAERTALRNAIARCHNERHAHYRNYGGRGIEVADEWRNKETGFAEFLAHIGPKPGKGLELDRIDNSLGYCPGNVRWVPRSVNAGNKRKAAEKCRDLGWGRVRVQRVRSDGYAFTRVEALITYKGRTQTVTDWAEELGVTASNIRQRLDRGWSLDRVMDPVLLNPWGKPRQDQG